MPIEKCLYISSSRRREEEMTSSMTCWRKFFAASQTKFRSASAIDEATFPCTIAQKPLSHNFKDGPNKRHHHILCTNGTDSSGDDAEHGVVASMEEENTCRILSNRCSACCGSYTLSHQNGCRSWFVFARWRIKIACGDF